MNIFKRACVSIALAFLLILPSTVLPFDKTPSPLKEFENVEYPDLCESVVHVFTHGVGLGFWFDISSGLIRTSVGTYAMAGKGTILKSKRTGRIMILTAAHVVSPKRVKMTIDKISTSDGPINSIITRTILIGTELGRGGPANILFIDEEADLALLEFSYTPEYVKPLEYKTSFTTDKLNKGDAIGIIVHKRDEVLETEWWFEFRIGKVLATTPIRPNGLPDYVLAWFSLSDFTIDAPVYPGDSGSPVIAWENGTPYIIGIARAYMMNRYTGQIFFYAVRIDYLHLFLEAY